MGDDTICSNGSVVANLDLSKNLGTRTNINIIADDWNPCSFSPPADTNRDLMRKVAVLSDDYLFVNNDSTFVPNIKTWTNLSFIGDTDAKSNLLVAINEPGTGEKQGA